MARFLSPQLIPTTLLVITFWQGAAAQDSRHPGRSGPRQPLPRGEEIALARSAAPASISDSASVYVFADSLYILAERGSNGNACYVSRSWPTSIEPHCFDAEGAASIMLIHMREVELLHRGMTPEQAAREVGALLLEGRLHLPRRPALTYMMSAGQKLISDDGRAVGRWRPHVMIYYPYLDAAQKAGEPVDVAAGIISGPGTAQSSITIVVPDFIPVRPAASSPP